MNDERRVDLLELLEAAAGQGGTLTFVEGRGRSTRMTFAELWQRSAGAAARLRENVEAGAAVAAVLTPSPPCIAAVIGALRGGFSLASLPRPARAMGLAEYALQLKVLCAASGAAAIMVDDGELAEYAGAPLPVLGYARLAADASAAGLPHGGRLLQFTSGSTSRPKGVVLPLDRVGANVAALVEGLELAPGDTICSWLPLSHDMGLIGAFLSAWASGADLLLMAPEVFVRDPAVWMRTCAEHGATHTWGPNFGYALAARAISALGDVSLASLRRCVVGAEPVRGDTVRAFVTATAPLGLDEAAITPGYGLAEATLGVTMGARYAPWRSDRLDSDALGEGNVVPAADGAGTEIVCVGGALPGMEFRIASGGQDIGEILVAGPSLLTGFVGCDVELVDGEWLRTGDLGYEAGGELFVTGRTDDLLLVAGRNLYAYDLELAAAEHPAVRAGNCVAASAGDGYVIVAERRHEADAELVGEAAAWIRKELSRRFGAAPVDVAMIVPGTLPKTPSGKIARNTTGRLYEAGALER